MCRGYAVLACVIMKKLAGRWRRSCFPLICFCSRRETGSMYETALQCLRAELERRKMPFPSQVNLDWFSGASAAAERIFPGITLCQGLWHQRRNILKNQKAGQRARAAEAEGAPRKRTKSGKLKKRPPHFKNRPVYAYLNLTAQMLLHPTRAFFHICASKIFARILHVWQEEEWLEYYLNQYMSQAKTQQTEKLGCQCLVTSTWWSGLGSKLLSARRVWVQCLRVLNMLWCFCNRALPCRPATQQPIEMLHAFFKRSLRSQRMMQSHADVVLALEDSVRAWASPLRENEELDSKLTSLAPQHLVSFQRPTDPDSWMMTTGLVRRSPFGKLKFYPSIPALVKRMRPVNTRPAWVHVFSAFNL